MITLGIQYGSHDTSAALVKDGQIIAVMEQERFNHEKHTLAFPSDAIRYCLKAGGIDFKDLNYIAYAGDPGFANVRKKSFIEKRVSTVFVPAMFTRADVEVKLRANLRELSPKADSVPLLTVDHHKAHAASAFFISPYKEAAVFTVDGMGNWVTTTAGFGKGHKIEPLFEIAHPHSLGLFYGAMTQYLGFRAACDECKVMGLASYGRPTYLDDFRELCRYENGTIVLDLDCFTFHDQPLMKKDGGFNLWYSEEFVRRFGPARIPESELTARDRDLAHSIQALLEERCYQLLNDLYRMSECENLCLAGGVALNSSMNGKIVDHTPFRQVFIIPAANDAGLSLGAALQCNAENSETFSRQELVHAYYGSEHPVDEMEREIRKLPQEIEVLKPANLLEVVAELLHRYEIVGWYQGRMEFGPRSLGNRTILANPTKAETKDIVNQKVKFRENFRPFAPVCPLEFTGDYFEKAEEMPYMLKVVKVREDKRHVIPAVTHVDHTARVQTIAREQNKLLYELLLEMKRKNGVPVLLNTSFNIRGDTIVRTPEDAIRCFLKTGMNSLVLGPYVLKKNSSKVFV